MQNLQIHRFVLADLPATPWKNGGGSTTELWCEPPSAGLDDFVWRVSVARIASDGPFSLFPGVDRVIALLQGAGVHLSGQGHVPLTELTTPLMPFAFPGEAHVTATRMGGDSLDFNVMTRRGRAQANWQTIAHRPGPGQEFKAAQGLVLCVPVAATEPMGPTEGWQGTPSTGGVPQTVLPGQGMVWSNAGGATEATHEPAIWQWRSAAGSALLAVGFERLSE